MMAAGVGSAAGLPVVTGGTTVYQATPGATWPKEQRSLFFDHLAMTGDVEAAATAAGVALRDAYTLRRCNPRFDEQWQRALLAGYERLEATMIQRLLNGAAQGEGAAFDLTTGLLMLERYRASQKPMPQAKAVAKAGGGEDRKKVEAELLRRLQAHARRLNIASAR